MNTRLAAFALVLVSTTGARAQTATKLPGIQPGSVAGRVIVGPNVPAPSCSVVFEGTPLSATCDADGNFVLKKVPPGTWTFDVTVPNLPTRKMTVMVNNGFYDGYQDPVTAAAVYLGEIQVGQLGGVTGQITLMNTNDLDTTVVSIPALGLYVQPNIGGYYLLSGVAPGTWSFVVYVKGRPSTPKSITVGSGQLLTGNDWTNIYTVNGTFTGGNGARPPIVP